jgi:DNA-binding NtrC family response regulator
MTELKILLIDDEGTMLMTYDTTLRMKGFKNITGCLDPVLGLEKAKALKPEIIFLDLMMGNYRGEDFIEALLEASPGTRLVIVSALDTVESAVKCIQKGASDYLVKPLNPARMIEIAQQYITKINIKSSKDLTYSSKVMENVMTQVSNLAPTPYPILITGETGTGKELIAKAIHRKSEAKGEWIALNVAGLDENVFSDTLFGHCKGAFTGAVQARQGQIAKAAKGTLFLDEIGDLDSRSQLKLLRLLQEGEYHPVGSDDVHHSQARVIMATHVNLVEKVKNGDFRQDLYYRLCSQWVHIPPLRERKEDLPVLAQHLNQKICGELKRECQLLPESALQRWMKMEFPGNIRELEGRVRQIILTGRDQLPSEIQEEPTAISVDRINGELLSLKDMTDRLIDEALERSGGKQIDAAKMLGISQQALSARLKKRKWG